MAEKFLGPQGTRVLVEKIQSVITTIEFPFAPSEIIGESELKPEHIDQIINAIEIGSPLFFKFTVDGDNGIEGGIFPMAVNGPGQNGKVYLYTIYAGEMVQFTINIEKNTMSYSTLWPYVGEIAADEVRALFNS